MQYREIANQWYKDAHAAGESLSRSLQEKIEAGKADAIDVAACCGLSLTTRAELARATTCFDMLPVHDALTLRVLPVEIDGERRLIVADPFDRQVREALLARFFGQKMALSMGEPGEVERLLDEAESSERVMDNMAIDASDETAGMTVELISLATIAKDENPVIRLVNSTLHDALQYRASDIHIESTAEGLSIRYRIDGVLQSIRQIANREMAVQTMSRLKVLATLDIAERRIPQDGRFKIGMSGREIDLRVSIIPGVYGENAVLRVLDRAQRTGMDLDILGFDDFTADRIAALSQRPYGLTLVTGPTGSGKSTTLYAMLSGINTGDDKIITIEDPVEYELDGVSQIPVNERKGLSFALGLRSILRHDPDTIMVGEIRDAETASIAVQSALTGHRVFSTVHANDGFSVIDRFIYMGVEPSTFLEALNGVISQRLVRRICRQCGEDGDGRADLAEMPLDQLKTVVVPGAGCEVCRGTGYSGRIGLAEVLTMDAAMKAALLERSMESRMRALAGNPSYRSMRETATNAVRRRLTTFQEVQRAIAME
ncbi:MULTISPECIES: GspE/PulE family protein [unclassified Herbaspirillum]|uniref:GspE/PulE family protein n=1 Tax=unclassified Herbaspirillum TaxID=2624150 RepID=UPI001151CAD6|nr:MULTISPECIES: GspE/PulE family protein [unclassified Herbaspirillum]MBB5390545.1 general secretion pathway protein E [Herbaspirillum sp. SJZ102]TQK08967.1 general secretion pathway protein E [Herbaspirillum sp. SJZ130]TQK14346.1 general secretion pathway protein E [Herbaspirillum sp. SJZ106]TWC66637.1 general secretion pathway protein E [Herbaspirillum sp. SJZ099]